MLQTARTFPEGARHHLKGIKFGLKHPSFLALAALPFIATLLLYVIGFYLMHTRVDSMLEQVWQIDPEKSSRLIGWLYWTYTHIVKFFVYIVVLAVMFYTFIVFANVLASPFYDHISEKYQRMFHSNQDRLQVSSGNRGIVSIMKEEAKKAVFMLLIPLFLIFIPVIGSILCLVVAAVFIAWDYVDFSLSRDHPLLRDRMRTLWRHKFLLMGFGFPLLVPFLGILVLPFAILGATKLYYDRIYDTGS
jgi:CysZ protein